MAEPQSPSLPEKPEPNPEWEAKADAWHAAIVAEVGELNPFDTLTMLETWKAHAEPADCDGRITFSRAMLDSAHDALRVALKMARAEYLRAKAAGEDANRWRALLRCGRIKMQGSSGVDPHTGVRNGSNVHFGAEFWPEKPDPEYIERSAKSTAWGRACLIALADAVVECEAAAKPETSDVG